MKRAKLVSPLRRILVLLAVSALVWLSLRNAAIALFGQVQPSLALAFPPPSGAALAADAAKGRLPPDDRDRIAAAALGRDPISPWPMVAAAQSALAREDPDRAATLFEAAVRRNSRHAEARGRLFQLYLADGRWSEAVDEGVALARLRPSMAENVMEALLLLLGEPRGRAILAAKLRDRRGLGAPAWRDTLVRAATGHPDEQRLGRLLRQAGSTAAP